MPKFNNINNLSRYIPSKLKRRIRRECGFGCVICGDALYEYAHLDPPFSEAEIHDPSQIALLCTTHHRLMTNGILALSDVQEARIAPKCLERGFSSFDLNKITGKSGFDLQVGNTRFLNLERIIDIDGESILALRTSNLSKAPPLLYAKFYDRSGNVIGEIIKNEWLGNPDTFDISMVKNRIEVRSDKGMIDLRLLFLPSRVVVIEKLIMCCGDIEIKGDSKNEFIVSSPDAIVHLPNDDHVISGAPYWISAEKHSLGLGLNCVMTFVNPDRIGRDIPGTMMVEGAEVWFPDPEDITKEGVPPPPVSLPNSAFRLTRVKTFREGGGITLRPASGWKF